MFCLPQQNNMIVCGHQTWWQHGRHVIKYLHNQAWADKFEIPGAMVCHQIATADNDRGCFHLQLALDDAPSSFTWSFAFCASISLVAPSRLAHSQSKGCEGTQKCWTCTASLICAVFRMRSSGIKCWILARVWLVASHSWYTLWEPLLSHQWAAQLCWTFTLHIISLWCNKLSISNDKISHCTFAFTMRQPLHWRAGRQ